MTDDFNLFFSNRLEILYQNLKHALFSSSQTPLARRLVVVYGPAMKNWLMLQMAQDPDLGVAMGIEFIYLNQAFDILLHNFCASSHTHIPTQIEIALAIEKEMMKVIRHFPDLSLEEQRDWLPFIQYLKLDPGLLSVHITLSLKMERRLIGLSLQIAQFFKDYGRYAGRLVAKWGATTPQGWQQRLWSALFNEKTRWSYPCQELQHPILPQQHCAIHFFSISFISHSEFNFLRRLSQNMPVYYYLLSPCAVFWSDIRSDKESAYLQAHWQQKLGSSCSQVFKLEELLRDRNALLANFGRLGREMAGYIEENTPQNWACYVLPSSIQQLNEDLLFNEDLCFIQTDRPLTLLHAIQSDMLLMQHSQEAAPLSILEQDLSIQLHMAPTRQREVQILYHNLMRLIEKESPHLCPKDMIVMAPHLMDYVPYIQSIFGSQESQLDFQILDLGMQSHNEIVQGFLQLLALSDSRWDATHLLQLFGHRAFQRRHQLTQSDYYMIQEWIEKVGIRWGEDLQHRNELLKRYHCQNGMVEETAIGTWDYGLARLLLGLTTVLKSPLTQSLDILPYDSIDFSQGDLLDRWMRLLHSLRDDLAPLIDQSRMTLEDWTDYLVCLLENYFQPDKTNLQSIEDYEDLKSQFEVLRLSSKNFKETDFSFQSIQTHLNDLLRQRGLTYRESHIQTVRFCSMTPLRSIPAKVIALLGMQEGAFPRMPSHSSLNLMVGQEGVDYCPNSADLDRYLFLEVLHSAQDYLLISYQGYSYTDHKELQPSLVVEELFSYLAKHYTVQGRSASQWCTCKHFFDSFHEAYFRKDHSLPNYSFEDYCAAQVYYQTVKHLPHRFVQEFVLTDDPEPQKVPESTLIDLKQLVAVVRNPIKFHLNHVLNIYLEYDKDRQLKNEEDFYLSPLDKYILKQSALKKPLEEVLSRAEKEGKLPFGLFKSIASQHIKEEMLELRDRFQKHDVNPQDLFQVEFCTTCSQPTQVDDDHWLLPAISVSDSEGLNIQIIGKLSHVTSKGLIVISKGSLADTWKAWPQFLLYHYAAAYYPYPLEHQLIMLNAAYPKKSFIENPQPYLRRLLDYYRLCLKSFSPLFPEWIPLILEGDAKGLQEKMKLAFSNSFGVDYQSHDLRWILHKDYLPNSEKMISQWKAQAELLLGDLVRHWYKNKNMSI